MAIALALVAAAFFGLSDFFGGIAARLVTTPARVAALMYSIQLVLYLAAGPLLPGRLDQVSALYGIAAGIGFALGLLFLYIALSQGPMTVASPIVALTAAIVPVLAGLALGERPSFVVSAGIAGGLAAALLLSQGVPSEGNERSWNKKSVLAAFGSGASFGAGFVCLSRVSPDSGVWPLALNVGVAAAILWLVVAFMALRGAAKGVSAPGPFLPARPIALAGLCAVLCAVGNYAMVEAFHSSMLTVVSVIVALSPASVVLLALTVLRERTSWYQRAGLLLAAVSIGVIAAG